MASIQQIKDSKTASELTYHLAQTLKTFDRSLNEHGQYVLTDYEIGQFDTAFAVFTAIANICDQGDNL